MGIPIRTIQRWEKDIIDRRKDIKKNPQNKLTPQERQEVIDVCCAERFVDLSPKQIVPILAEQGKYIASEATMYRILREESMMNHRESTKKPVKRNKPEELKATGPDQIWSWDITYIKTAVRGIFFYLYLFMDVWSRKIVAWDIYDVQTSENAKQVMLSVKDEVDDKEIRLHSDNGSPMKGATFLSTLQWLGVVPSFSRPSCSNDNAYSESLFKTIKYRAGYPKVFKSRDESKNWLSRFIKWYNKEHRHSGINYVTPEQRHKGLDKKILKRREEVYRKARAKNPERWINKKMRAWSWNEEVILNPNTKVDKNVA